MAKFHLMWDRDDETQYMFFCPACKCGHIVKTKGTPAWTLIGLENDSPTVSPSILVRSTEFITDEQHALIMSGGKFEPKKTVCHSFVRNGKIEFLNDCTHALAGQTVDIEDFNV
jgi:hypothetical protein